MTNFVSRSDSRWSSTVYPYLVRDLKCKSSTFSTAMQRDGSPVDQAINEAINEMKTKFMYRTMGLARSVAR